MHHETINAGQIAFSPEMRQNQLQIQRTGAEDLAVTRMQT
jgi:hypothetical protein